MAGATSYNVYAGTGSQVSNIPAGTSTTISANLTELPSGTDYFKVAWVNASGTSGLSAAAISVGKGGGGAMETWMLAALGVGALIALNQRVRRWLHRARSTCYEP